MKHRLLQQISTWLRLGLAVLMVTAIAAPGQAACPSTPGASSGSPALEGHWIVTVIQPNGKFVNLVTFTAKGDIEIFASYRQTISIGRGTYCRVGDREFAVAMTQIGYNSSLVQTELVTIRSTIKLNQTGDEFTGPDKVEVVDPSTGQVLFSGDGGSVAGKLVQP